MKAHVDEKAALEIRLEALRKAQPDFEAFNKAVLATENTIITALKDCMEAQQKRGWLSGFFTAGREAQQFRLIKDKHIKRLADWEKELVQKWPSAYSDIKRHPQSRWPEQHWSYYVGWRDGKDQGLKFLLYEVNTDISLCEMWIADIIRKREAAEKASENNRLRRERQETRKARIAALLNQARSNAQAVISALPRNHPCPYCTGPLGDFPHADHIHPVAKGGHSTRQNMVYVCQQCNNIKSDSTLTAFIAKEGKDLNVVLARLRALGKDV